MHFLLQIVIFCLVQHIGTYDFGVSFNLKIFRTSAGHQNYIYLFVSSCCFWCFYRHRFISHFFLHMMHALAPGNSCCYFETNIEKHILQMTHRSMVESIPSSSYLLITYLLLIAKYTFYCIFV